MVQYAFAVRVVGLDLDNDDQFARLEDEDLTVIPSSSDGVQTLDVVLEADSSHASWIALEEFLRVRAPEIGIQRLDFDLVTLSEAAERLDVSRETVRLWANGSRRKGFPAPFAAAGQSQLWTWADVHDWAEPDEGPHPLPTSLVERVNGALARKRAMRATGWTTAAISPRGRGFAMNFPDANGKPRRQSVRYSTHLTVTRTGSRLVVA